MDTHFEWGLKIFLLWPLLDEDNEDENSLDHNYLI